MRKKRLRGGTHEQQTTVARQRTTRVRNRLVVSVAIVAAAVLGAGVPGILGAADDLHDTQHLVDLAQANRGAVALAHSLADERDAMTEFVAAGRATAAGGVTESQRARVDRQVAEYRGQAPASVRALLDALPKTRQQALTGPGKAADTYTAYTDAVQALHGVADTLAHQLPARAGTGSAAALPPLGRAVEEASATRGLLLGALASHGSTQNGLTAAAQRTDIREKAALADFEQLAPPDARDSFSSTVNGPDVTAADDFLTRLTARSELSTADRDLPKSTVESALTARIDRMRGVESALASSEITRLEKLRDDDVTALELDAALLGLCFLVAAGASAQAARSMTRPLAALRLGARRVAADPAGEQPIVFKGRDDEFAEVVRSVNTLHEAAANQRERITRLEGERSRLIGARQALADERETLQTQQARLRERIAALTGTVHGTYVNLSLRTLTLVERQLGVIETMEANEQDPERLETLFKLDHLATRMRRHSENLLVLAGAEHGSGHSGSVPLLDMVRASISEIEKYERVQIQALPPHAQVAGFAADDTSHLVAELLENATAFSPPDARVQLSGWLLESGDVMLSVQDEGIGMPAERLAAVNALLAAPDPQEAHTADGEQTLGLGLYVVAQLASRHGVRVQLRAQQQGGMTAVVVLPKALLPTGPSGPGPAPVVPGGAGAPAFQLPGSIAEANSNALPGRGEGAPRTGETPVPDGPQPVRAQPEPAPVPRQNTGPQRRPAPDPDAAPPEPPSQDPERKAGPDPLIEAAERTIQLAAIPDPQQPPTGRHARRTDEPPSGADTTPPDASGRPVRAVPDGPAHVVPPPVTGQVASAYTPGPDEHARPAADLPHPAGAARRRPADGDPADPAADDLDPRTTDKGLPKRTPRTVTMQDSAPRQSKGVDAEALRRQLGGFQQGARDGRRDAEAEITAGIKMRNTDHQQAGALDEAGTAEEARD
ncbi:nitrate- and nitrite sensing domain-containing protein [Streptomyces sp. NPDC057654]|uniref:sensor histidine kinase n=1 Tax=Streptomyces sp. NPDC057654 TaxID=3346196 RepID=UPI00367DCEAC